MRLELHYARNQVEVLWNWKYTVVFILGYPLRSVPKYLIYTGTGATLDIYPVPQKPKASGYIFSISLDLSRSGAVGR